MSLQILGAAWELGPREPSLRILLMAYAEHADVKTGECWPSDKRLETITGMSNKTVRRHRQTLVQQGWLLILSRHRTPRGMLGTNTVQINLSKIGLITTGQSDRTTGQSDRSPSVNLTSGQTTGQSDRTKNNIKNNTRAKLAGNSPLLLNLRTKPLRQATALTAQAITVRLSDFQKKQIRENKSVVIDDTLILSNTDEHKALANALTKEGVQG